MDSGDRPLDAAQGQLLLKLARSTLMAELGITPPAAYDAQLTEAMKEPWLNSPGATFVTLTLHGRLRGCIGSLCSTDPLAVNIRRNAVHAAFHDPRFTPLTAQEIDQARIEVSVLTEPRPMSYATADELRQRLRPHRDGVILRQGHASATFLPQVWEQLPNAGEFLGQLCLKAGLPRHAWKECLLEVSTYQVQHFEEPPT
jgi:AmmeMemoRadiSam system protein A